MVTSHVDQGERWKPAAHRVEFERLGWLPCAPPFDWTDLIRKRDTKLAIEVLENGVAPQVGDFRRVLEPAATIWLVGPPGFEPGTKRL